MNDYQFKVAKIAGDFIWHAHGDTDEAFIVLEGVLRIDFRDHRIELQAGEMAVVPRGVEHKTFAATEAKLLMIEPMGFPTPGIAIRSVGLPTMLGYKTTALAQGR